MMVRFAGLVVCACALLGCQAVPGTWTKRPIDRQSPGCVAAQKDPSRHDAFMKDKEELLKKGPIGLVFIGDSITDGWRGGPQNEIYKKYFGKYNPYNIGISGDETQHVLWRIEKGELDGIAPKLVVMMIGTNNLGNSKQTAAQTIDGVMCVVEAVEKKLPKAKILLLGVFPRGEKADNAFRAQIAEVNAALATLPATDGQVKYLDIGPRFLAEDGTLPRYVMPDSLHPNAVGYQIWADAIGPVVEKMMK